MHVLSLDRAMSANSMNLDWLLISEAKYIDYDKLKSEIFPANRGNRQYFGACPWHHSVQATTDMPTSTQGTWILEKQKEMDAELIDIIRSAYFHIQRLKSLPEPTDYVKKQLRNLSQDIDEYRANATFYAEYSIIDHFEILGEKWIYQMKRDLPPLMFRTSICNERIRKIANGFYSALDDKLHFYVPAVDNGRMHLCDMDKYKGVNCIGDSDLDYNEPLWFAFDSNSAINSAVAGQVIDGELRTLKSFFVKTPKKLPELLKDICEYYASFTHKEAIVPYDSTFAWQTGNTSESYIDTIVRILESNGWNVTPTYLYRPVHHDWKHKEIDRALKGEGDQPLLFPRFNLPNTEYLKLAMEQTGIRMGSKGFEKDKRAEGYDDSPQRPDELKTHITDAWDTFFIGANYYHVSPIAVGSGTVDFV
jgi:hypothetical protein